VKKGEIAMTTGQVMVAIGIVLVVAAVLLITIGNLVLRKRKKTVLLEIEHEYR